MPGAGRFIFVGWASPTDASLRGQGRRAIHTLRWLTQRRAEYNDETTRRRFLAGSASAGAGRIALSTMSISSFAEELKE